MQSTSVINKNIGKARNWFTGHATIGIGIMKNQSLSLVIEQVGGQRRLGELIGVAQQTVSFWLTTNAKIPAEKAIVLERATKGNIPRWVSRPDLWDAPAHKKTLARR